MDWTSLNKKKLVEARPFFEESIACLEDRSSAATLNGYYSLLATVLNKAETPEDKQAAIGDLLNEYLRLSDYIEAGRQRLVAAGDSAKAEKYVTTQKNLDEVFVQVANCDDMVPVLEGKLAANPDDLDTKKKALRLLNEKGCTDNDIFLPVAEAVYAVEKNADAAYSIGIQLAKKGDYAAALPYFEEAVELCEDCPKAARNLMKAGQVAKNAGQVSKCIRYARKAAKADPGNGEPYLLIGDAVASKVSACSDSPWVDERCTGWPLTTTSGPSPLTATWPARPTPRFRRSRSPTRPLMTSSPTASPKGRASTFRAWARRPRPASLDLQQAPASRIHPVVGHGADGVPK